MVTWQVVRGASVNSSGVDEATLQLIEELIVLAGQDWSRYFADVDVNLRVQLDFEDKDPEDASVIATGGANFEFAGFNDAGNALFLTSSAAAIIDGVDPVSTDIDITITFNLDQLPNIFFDSDPTTSDDLPFNQLDGYSIILHELGHGLGFLGAVEQPFNRLESDLSITTYDQFIAFDGDDVPFFTGFNARANFGGDVPLTIGNNSHVGNSSGPGAELTGFGGDLLQESIANGRRLPVSSLNIAILADTGITIRTATGGNEALFGFDLEADFLAGLEGDDTLTGLSGHDTLTGGAGDDVLSGGSGLDTFVFFGNDGMDIVTDFQSGDRLDFRGVPANFQSLQDVIDAAETATVDGVSGVLVDTGDGTSVFLQNAITSQLISSNILFGDPDPSLIVAPAQIGNLEAQTIMGDDGNNFIDGGAGDDFLNGGAGADTINGGADNDGIFAGPGDLSGDVFVGAGGNDTIGGGEGDDLLVGGSFDEGATDQTLPAASSGFFSEDGVDTIFGGPGNDTLIGGSLIDSIDNGVFDFGEAVVTGFEANTIFSGTGDDLVFGAGGSDILGGGTGDDRIEAGGGNDTIFGGPGDEGNIGLNDFINAGAGNDEVFSSGGNDSINGGSGNDTLFSGEGNDSVNGGSGNDLIFAGAGDDIFSGGTGTDTFAFFSGHGDDIITDINVFADIVDLSETNFDFQSISDVQNRSEIFDVGGGVTGILLDTGGGDSIFLVGVNVNSLLSIDFLF